MEVKGLVETERNNIIYLLNEHSTTKRKANKRTKQKAILVQSHVTCMLLGNQF